MQSQCMWEIMHRDKDVLDGNIAELSVLIRLCVVVAIYVPADTIIY